MVDAPKASKLPTVLEVTDDDLAVVRFHGRADDTWDVRTGSAAERFNYLYSKQQLRPWAKKLERLAAEAREVHALMNNCYQDYGVRQRRRAAGDARRLTVSASARSTRMQRVDAGVGARRASHIAPPVAAEQASA